MSIGSIFVAVFVAFAFVVFYLSVRAWCESTRALEQDSDEDNSQVNFPLS